MSERLLVIAPIPPELEAKLAEAYTLVRDRPDAGDSRPGYRVAVTTSMGGIDAAMMDALPDLELVLCNGAGLDRIDSDGARKRGIRICNTPDAVTEDTADFAIGLMYAAARRIAEADRFVRSGAWTSNRMTPSRRVFSRTLGIVGLGRIGSAVARRAAAIGMTVRYTGPREKPGVPYAYDADPVALARAVDVLVLTCPAGPATERLVDAPLLDALGADGLVVNVSRGSVVDEEALVAALYKGTIAGAALDVFASEPDIDPRFATFENVVLQPHYAAVTREARADMASTLREAVDALYAAPTAG